MNLPTTPVFSSEAVDADLEEPKVMPISAWLAPIAGALGSISLGFTQGTVACFLAIFFGLLALRPRGGVQLYPLARGMAYAGIALGAFFATTTIRMQALEKQYVAKYAERFARDWLEILRQREYEYATELAAQRGGRQILGTDLKAYYASLKEESAANFMNVKNLQVSQNLELATESPDWRLTEPPMISRRYETHRIAITLEDKNGVVKAPVTLTMRREFDQFSKNNEWWIAVND